MMNNPSTLVAQHDRRTTYAWLLFGVFCLVGMLATRNSTFYLGGMVQHLWQFTPIAFINSVLAFLVAAVFLLSLNIVSLPLKNRYWEELIRSNTFFVTVMVALVFVWRWSYTVHYQLNPDESQDLAAAITLLKNPLYWKSVDTMTHGPLISCVLLVPALFGIQPDYASARLVGLTLMSGSLFALWRILLRFVDPMRARIFVAPVALSIALNSFFDFVAYNGEHLTIFLCMFAAFLGVEARFTARPKSGWLSFLSGVFLGLIPYAKIQGIPIAFAIGGILLLGQCNALEKRKVGTTLAKIAPLLAGALLPTLLTILYVVSSGLGHYVFHSYIVWTLQYSAGEKGATGGGLAYFVWPIQSIYDADPLAMSLTVSFPVGAALYLKSLLGARRGNKHLPLILCGLTVFAAAYFAVCKPGRVYTHYLLLLLFPGGFLNAVLWESVLATFKERTSQGATFLRAGFVGVNILLPLFFTLSTRLQFTRSLTLPALGSSYSVYYLNTTLTKQLQNEAEEAEFAQTMRKLADGSSTLTVWGWSPAYHVLSRLPQGTRDSIIFRIITQNGYKDPYFLAVYLSDLKKSKPTFFLDSVGFGKDLYLSRRQFGIQAFPEINAYVQANYVLLESNTYASLYISKDYLKQKHLRISPQQQGKPSR